MIVNLLLAQLFLSILNINKMATADIAKLAVFDGRIVQAPPKYAVQKGALSLTNTNYAAISQSASQHTYNLNIPSQSVFIDRGMEWTSSCLQSFDCQVQTANSSTCAPAAGPPVTLNVTNPQPVAVLGKDWALCSYPLHQCVGTMTSTVNDTSVVMNTDTVLREVLRLADYKRSRLMKTAPAQLDRYALYKDANGAVNNPISLYANAYDPDNVPNGAWYDIIYTDSTGVALSTAGTAAAPTVFATSSGQGSQLAIGGVPIRTPNNFNPAAPALAGSAYAVAMVNDPALGQVAGGGGSQAFYRLYVKWTSTEKLVLSPFVFADQYEWSTGLFGCNNIQFVFNISSQTAARTIRSNSANAQRVIGNVQFGQISSTGQAFEGSRISVQFLTPSLDLDLPAKSVVPYAEYPRYIFNEVPSIPAKSTATAIQSQTITLPQIPDALIIYCKPKLDSLLPFSPGTNGITSVTQAGDFYFPITRVNITFDNFSGLLSAHTTQQLYQMAVHNGLEMDFGEWQSRTRRVVDPTAGAPGVGSPGSQGEGPLVGGFLVLRMGQDIPLQSGQAPGLVGNFSLQYQVDIYNPLDVAHSPSLFLIAVNTGFFETLAGSSRVVKGLLSEADIISAPPVEAVSSDGLSRVVGSGFFDKVGSFLTKHGPALAAAAKPLASAALSAMPDEGMAGAVKRGARAVGMGYGGPAGGGVTGGMMSRRLL